MDAGGRVNGGKGMDRDGILFSPNHQLISLLISRVLRRYGLRPRRLLLRLGLLRRA